VHSAAQAQKVPHLLEKTHNSRPTKDDDLYMKLQHEGNSSDEYESPKVSICPNCKDKITSSNLASHTIECYRNSTKCKICGEVVKKSQKKSHLDYWRSKQKVKEVLQKDNDNELTKILDHGLLIDYKFDEENCSI
jgi:superfamily II helicase